MGPFLDPPPGDKTFRGKKNEKPYVFLKGSKDLLTPINGKSINWTHSEILRISLRGINVNSLETLCSHIIFFKI